MNNNSKLLLAKILKRMPCARGYARKFNESRHRAIESFIYPWCVKAEDALPNTGVVEKSNNGPVWVSWWQGVEQAPAVVQACIASMRRHCGARDVVVITRDNVREYADLPFYIYEKLDSGAISLTHFSDILRFNLLRRHGGLWMDSTLYAAKDLDMSRCFGEFFTCSGYADPTGFFVTKGKWTGFFIGGSADERLFAFMDTFFLQYWKDNDTLIDYFLIDYVLRYAYDHRIGSLRAWADTQAGKDDPQLFGLEGIVSKMFDVVVWQRLTADTAIFKLSWKKPRTFPAGSFGEYILTHGE